MAQIERCKRQRLRRYYANSAGGMGGADHGARADSAPGCARRREAALQGAGREGAPYRPSHARRIRGWIAHRGKSGICGGGVASRPRAANAPVPTARRIAPDSRAAFAQSGGGARRTHPKAIFRLSRVRGRSQAALLAWRVRLRRHLPRTDTQTRKHTRHRTRKHTQARKHAAGGRCLLCRGRASAPLGKAKPSVGEGQTLRWGRPRPP